MIIKKIFYLFLSVILVFITCQTNDTPLSVTLPQIMLKADYVAVTEAWLQVHAENISDDQYLKIWRDTRVIFYGILDKPDTIVYNNSLLPAHNYTYYAAIVKNGKRLFDSQPLKITTKDTTSNEFNWNTFIFGGTGGGSVLYDVAIINPNDIWCMGVIYADSVQPWNPYNVVHYDGQQWELKRINYNGSPWPIRSVFAFSANDIWFDAFVKWNGTNFIQLPIPSILIGHSINKTWGTSSNDLYVVGSEGLIAHYNGSDWRKLESGTDVNLLDIWGTPDGNEVWACGWNSDSRSILLRKNKDQWETLWSKQNPSPPWIYSGDLSSLWTSGNIDFMLAGGKVYRHSLLDLSEIYKEPIVLDNFAYRVRGSDRNNIALAGDLAMIWHYNGINWHYYNELLNENDRTYGLGVSEDLIVTVGTRYNSILRDALIIIGRR
jgi:hypothetical protein